MQCLVVNIVDCAAADAALGTLTNNDEGTSAKVGDYTYPGVYLNAAGNAGSSFPNL